MNKIKISDFKSHLSEHLKKVRAGGELIVTDRETPIAKVIPFSAQSNDFEVIEAEIPSPKDIHKIKRPNITKKIDVLKVLQEERGEN